MFVFWEDCQPLVHEGDELIRHGVELVNVAVRVDVAEARPNGIVDEENICKLVPRPRVLFQLSTLENSVRSNLHQGAIHRAATGSTIQPDDSSLPIADMSILIMPEEDVAVVFRSDFNVPGSESSV